MQKVRVLGHRGAPRRAVENSLEALAAALDEGADGVEFDVRLCRSGELVLCHDETLGRFTGRATRVARSSAWGLAQSDLGGGARVPTLAAALALLVRRGAYANVEVKAEGTGPLNDPETLAIATWSALARVGLDGPAARERVVVSSFDPRVLVELRAIAPEIPRGLLLDPEYGRDSLARSLWSKVAPAAVHPCGAVTPSEEISRWRSIGYAVNPWTVDDPGEALRLASAGASALITNEPGRIGAVLREGL